MKMKLFLLHAFTLAALTIASAQDIQFSQYYNSPLYLNPGYTGITPEHRLVANYRVQWPGLPQAFTSSAFSYDMFVDELRSGFGLQVTTDKMGTAGWSTTTAGLLYSYKVRLSKKWVFSPGLYFGYGVNGIDRSKLRLGDGLELEFFQGGVYNSVDPDQNKLDREQYFDFGSGGVFYNKNFWFGAAFHHINEPTVSLLGEESKLPMKGSIHSGFRINLSDTRLKSRSYRISYLTPSLMYRWQGTMFSQFDVGLNYHVDPVSVGVWYRGKPWKKDVSNGVSKDALIFQIGLYMDNLTIGYSYDFTISGLETSVGGAHEIALVYQFVTGRSKQKNKSKGGLIPCPTFYNKENFWKSR